MKATGMQEVVKKLGPDAEDDYNVSVVLYDKFKAPTDTGYITRPYKYDTLDDLPPLPEHKSGYEHTIIHQDGRTWEYRHLQEMDDPPDWFPESDN